MSETAVTSFILRFIREPDADPAVWRGVIRHVQSSQETHFTRMEDALDFMAGYVAIRVDKEKEEKSGT